MPYCNSVVVCSLRALLLAGDVLEGGGDDGAGHVVVDQVKDLEADVEREAVGVGLGFAEFNSGGAQPAVHALTEAQDADVGQLVAGLVLGPCHGAGSVEGRRWLRLHENVCEKHTLRGGR